MGKLNLSRIISQTKKIIFDRSPEILTGIGIAGMITTTILAVKATPKAIKLIEKDSMENHDGDPNAYSKKEAIKSCWKCYIPSAISGVASVACLIGASSVNLRRNTALATAYKLSEAALSEYKDKVIETVGEHKETVIRDKVSEEKIKNNPVSKNNIIVTNDGDTLCFDPMSSRYFYSTIDKIQKAENELNSNILNGMLGYASLNDFYDELNLDRTEIGDLVGWNSENRLKIRISAQVADNGKPSIVIDYVVRPYPNYDKL